MPPRHKSPRRRWDEHKLLWPSITEWIWPAYKPTNPTDNSVPSIIGAESPSRYTPHRSVNHCPSTALAHRFSCALLLLLHALLRLLNSWLRGSLVFPFFYLFCTCCHFTRCITILPFNWDGSCWLMPATAHSLPKKNLPYEIQIEQQHRTLKSYKVLGIDHHQPDLLTNLQTFLNCW